MSSGIHFPCSCVLLVWLEWLLSWTETFKMHGNITSLEGVIDLKLLACTFEEHQLLLCWRFVFLPRSLERRCSRDASFFGCPYLDYLQCPFHGVCQVGLPCVSFASHLVTGTLGNSKLGKAHSNCVTVTKFTAAPGVGDENSKTGEVC